MNVHYSDNRKVDPSQGPRLGDGTENDGNRVEICLLYTSPSPRDLSTSRMPSSA